MGPVVHQLLRVAVPAAILAGPPAGPLAAQADRTSASGWAAVDSAAGRHGMPLPGGVWKYGFPRGDLSVSIGSVALRPALALGSWVALKRTGRTGRTGRTAMLMGDLVLLEAEVGPVTARLEELGLRPMALHNHLLGESPRVMYLHVFGRGDPVKLAGAIRSAMALTGTPAAGPDVKALAVRFELDTAQLAAALGRTGTVNGGVYQVSVARAEPVSMDGMVVPPAMGVATALNFQPIGGGRAVTTGDFVLRAEEVDRVAVALRKAGIAVTAIHSHMLGEMPRLYFMHFWGEADAIRLARGLRGALALTHAAR